MESVLNNAVAARQTIEALLKSLERDIATLIDAIKLAECQYLSCGGNLSDAEIVRNMRSILNDALSKTRMTCGAIEGPGRKCKHVTLLGRLRSVCMDCEKHYVNAMQKDSEGLQPVCSYCKLHWEAAAEIEFLRGRVERLISERST